MFSLVWGIFTILMSSGLGTTTVIVLLQHPEMTPMMKIFFFGESIMCGVGLGIGILLTTLWFRQRTIDRRHRID